MIDPEHLFKVRDRLIAERGSLTLLALFDREDSLGKWDLLVAGGGLREDMLEGYQHVGKILLDCLTTEEMVSMEKMVILPADYPPVLEVVERAHEVGVGTKVIELYNFDFYQFRIRRALVFHAAPVEVAAARA
jgi:hypothetical protein